MALEAIQILGGNGYINDYPTGRLLRDAKLYEIGAGTSEIRRMLIGRELFKETALSGTGTSHERHPEPLDTRSQRIPPTTATAMRALVHDLRAQLADGARRRRREGAREAHLRAASCCRASGSSALLDPGAPFLEICRARRARHVRRARCRRPASSPASAASRARSA